MLGVGGTGDASLWSGSRGIGQTVPTASETHRLDNAERTVLVDDDAVVGLKHRVLGYRDDQNLVVGQMTALDRLPEGHTVHLRARR